MNYNRRNDEYNNRSKFNTTVHRYVELISLFIAIVYPIGAWFTWWDFSSIAMSTITIIAVYMTFKEVAADVYVEDIRLFIMETEYIIEEAKVDTDMQLNELLSLNKMLVNRVEDIEKEIVSNTELVEIDTDKQLNELLSHNKKLVIKIEDIEKTKEHFSSILEQFEILAEQNEQLNDIHINKLELQEDDIEVKDILVEQVQALIIENNKLMDKNETLLEQIEILIANQRNIKG